MLLPVEPEVVPLLVPEGSVVPGVLGLSVSGLSVSGLSVPGLSVSGLSVPGCILRLDSATFSEIQST